LTIFFTGGTPAHSPGLVRANGTMLEKPTSLTEPVRKQKSMSQKKSRICCTSAATLIPAVEFGISWTGKTARHKTIWLELQHELVLERHSNAVAVLFRVLLELSVEHYLAEKKLPMEQKLSRKVVKSAQHMLASKVIDNKYASEIRKFENAEAIISANTMNAYVHSADFSPSSNI